MLKYTGQISKMKKHIFHSLLFILIQDNFISVLCSFLKFYCALKKVYIGDLEMRANHSILTKIETSPPLSAARGSK